MGIRSSLVRACLALGLLFAPAATQAARAQESGVPQELTVSELRQVLEILLALDRQRALFGVAAAGALLASLIHPIVGLLLLLVAVP